MLYTCAHHRHTTTCMWYYRGCCVCTCVQLRGSNYVSVHIDQQKNYKVSKLRMHMYMYPLVLYTWSSIRAFMYVHAYSGTPLHPWNEDTSFNQGTMHGPSYVEKCKSTLEMRTPPLIRTLEAVSRVSRIESFHCTCVHNWNYVYVCALKQVDLDEC